VRTGSIFGKIQRNVTLIANGLSPGQKWHTHRKMITPTFHFNILDSFLEVFSEKSEILINKLKKEVGSKGFDVCPYIAKCTLDIICGERMRRHFYEAVHPITFCSTEQCIQTC
jgi:cytochrome P450